MRLTLPLFPPTLLESERPELEPDELCVEDATGGGTGRGYPLASNFTSLPPDTAAADAGSRLQHMKNCE